MQKNSTLSKFRNHENWSHLNLGAYVFVSNENKPDELFQIEDFATASDVAQSQNATHLKRVCGELREEV